MEERYVNVEGALIPKFFENNTKRAMADQVKCIRVLDMREDDVIICAYPKCGTHWFWEMVSMLVSGNAQSQSRAKNTSMLEVTPIENIQSLPSPRVLSTHLPVTMLPKQIMDKNIKVIHVYRNCKDTVVSDYFHEKQYSEQEDLTIETHIPQVLNSDDKASYVSFMKSMDQFIKNNPDFPVLSISYEDAKEDTARVVKGLGDFLGVSPSAQLCADVTEATSFHRMKEADQQKERATGIPRVEIFRKGEVGDWTNHLTIAQSQRIDVAMTELKDCNFRVRYTL